MKTLMDACRKTAAKYLPDKVKRMIHLSVRALKISVPIRISYSGNLKDMHSTRETILLVCSAANTPASILTLNMIQEFKKKYNVVVMLLEPGDLIDNFRDVATIVVDPLPRLSNPERAAAVIDQLLKLFVVKFSVITSVKSQSVLPGLSRRFIPTVVIFDKFATELRPLKVVGEILFWANESIFSARVLQENIAAFGVELINKKSAVVYPGCCVVPYNPNVISLESEANKISKAFRPPNFPKDTLAIIGIGPIQISKEIDLFLQCAAAVLRSSQTACRFIWIDSKTEIEKDKDDIVYLLDQVKRAGLEKFVIFLDNITHLKTVYEQADILLLNSPLEPVPNFAIEAMMHEVPLVCFDGASGIAEVLTNHGLGDECVAPYLDMAGLVVKVKKFIESPENRKKVGGKLKEIATHLFNMQTYVKQIESISLSAVLDTQQENKDCLFVAKSNLLSLEFYLPAHWKSHSYDAAIRCFIRSWASGIQRRKPFPGFHPGIYFERNQHIFLDKCDPFAHYIQAGMPSGPWQFEVLKPSKHRKKISFKSRIALHLHVYYPDLIQDMMERLDTNEIRPDLLISVPSEQVLKQVSSVLENYKWAVSDIQIVPDRGRDVGPFLITFGEKIVEKYDIIGHLHTKKTLHFDAGFGRRWYLFLMENLLGGQHRMADTILEKMESDSTIGLVFPDDPYVAGWFANRTIASELADKLKLEHLPENFNFPIGTMFWARTEAIKPLFDLNLGWDDCPFEPLPSDGTILHAIERLFPFVVEKKGLRTVVTHVPGMTRW